MWLYVKGIHMKGIYMKKRGKNGISPVITATFPQDAGLKGFEF